MRRVLLGIALLVGAGCSSTSSASVATTSPVTASEGVDTTAASTTTPPSTEQVAPSTSLRAATTSTAAPTSTPYWPPVADFVHMSYGHVHHDYPASDIFVSCGADVVSPVNGSVLEVRTVDSWTKADNPATRGGKSIAIRGDDGVRYYFAHLDTIDDSVTPGHRVLAADRLGTIGQTGKASACHLHFGISPPCPGKEWAVRRGVVWPWPYLDAWRKGKQVSPLGEVEQWVVDHPTACADAMADPNAADS